MLKINKKTEYALMALKHIDSKGTGKKTSASELVDTYKIPFDTISKILQQLAAKSVLNSIQGPKGGYELACSLENIYYPQIVEWIEGKSASVKCLENQTCDKQDFCNIIGPLKNLEDKTKKFLENLSIKELLT